jgi:predicted Zn-dependent protease
MIQKILKQQIWLYLFLLTTSFIACSTNPATGERRVSLISEGREIEMGKEADKQISAQLGLYDNQQLQAYVNQLGQDMARLSERPNLPWTFRVIDDPMVNAFALPGGYIYITRGILSHLNSQDQLEGVLGHEIGHVTAKHSVYRISEQQLLQIGFGVAMIAKPELQQFADIAGLGLGLLYLKYGRDDEREADMLGVRYMTRVNSDPSHLVGVMEVLERVSSAQGQGRIPQWLSTHPDPGNRISLIREHIDTLQNNNPQSSDPANYLAMLDGVVFGQNPREGYFKNNLFLHPEMQFSFTFPEGWTYINQKQAVLAVSKNEDAIIQISLTDEPNPESAARKFFAQQGVSGNTQSTSVNGLPASSGAFTAATQQGNLSGNALYLSHNNRVFQILAFGTQNSWRSYEAPAANSLRSFNIVTDPNVLNVQPQRLKIVTVNQQMTLRQAAAQYSPNTPVETIAMINQLTPDAQVASGTRIKVVDGAPLP